MGTTAQKLEYLGTTKSQLKDMINYGLDNNNKITSSTTFRNYVSSIFNAFLEALRTPDTLFTNLPKKSGTGANITLNDTANAPMRIELGASELTQAGTPTPSYPQDIHTISGSNKIKVEGKNLFNKSLIENNKVSNGYGDIGVTPYVVSSVTKATLTPDNAIKVEPNTTYTFTHTNTIFYFALAQMTSEKVSLGDTGWKAPSTIPFTITTGATCEYIGFNFRKEDNTTITNDEFNTFINSAIQLNKGNATSYTPYVSQEADIDLGDIEYGSIGNYEDKFIRTSGKNLFDKFKITENTYIDEYGTTGTSSVTNLSEYIEVSSSTNYNLSYNYITLLNSNGRNICYYNLSKTFISGITYQPGSKSNQFTTPNNAKYIRFSYDKNCYNIMLNEGTTALDYEPYGTNQWYIKKNIGKVVLDGSETWESASSPAGTSRFFTNNNIFLNNNANYNDVKAYSPTFKGMSWNDIYSDDTTTIDGVALWVSGTLTGRLVIRIDETLANTTNTFKTWLESNNTIVYYIMATPTYTQITGTLAEELEAVRQKLLSQKGQTNISQVNNDLPFTISATTLKSLTNL